MSTAKVRAERERCGRAMRTSDASRELDSHEALSPAVASARLQRSTADAPTMCRASARERDASLDAGGSERRSRWAQAFELRSRTHALSAPPQDRAPRAVFRHGRWYSKRHTWMRGMDGAWGRNLTRRLNLSRMEISPASVSPLTVRLLAHVDKPDDEVDRGADEAHERQRRDEGQNDDLRDQTRPWQTTHHVDARARVRLAGGECCRQVARENDAHERGVAEAPQAEHVRANRCVCIVSSSS